LYESLKADNKTKYYLVVTMPQTAEYDKYIDVFCEAENSQCKDYVSNIAKSNTDKNSDMNKLIDGTVNGTLELGDILLPSRIREII
jgi:hypothetical protein